MYIPKSFAVSDVETLYAFMRAHNFATMVTQHDGQMTATAIPFMIDSERGVLKAHLARANGQWKQFGSSESLVIFQGAHAYISPTWYGEHPSVPTWNYTAVHVYGVPQLIEDDATIQAMLRALVENHEHGRAPEWEMNLPEDYMQKMVKSIVVFEIPMTRVEGKFKMSQNRSEADQVSVMTNLAASHDALDQQTADIMRSLQKVDLPSS
jgi:transcriptional regulator